MRIVGANARGPGRDPLRWCVLQAGGLCAAAAVMFASAAAPASAELIWNWSYAGTEAGTFTTNGVFADTTTSGTFTISSMNVTSSVVSAAVGTPMNEGSFPGNGFVWNGTSATMFFKNADNPPPDTNSSVFYTLPMSGRLYEYAFGIDTGGAIAVTGEYVGYLQIITPISPLTLTPVTGPGPAPVPEIDPAGMGSVLALVIGGLGLLERRRLKTA